LLSLMNIYWFGRIIKGLRKTLSKRAWFLGKLLFVSVNIYILSISCLNSFHFALGVDF
jgi:hypothetical protein